MDRIDWNNIVGMRLTCPIVQEKYIVQKIPWLAGWQSDYSKQSAACQSR